MIDIHRMMYTNPFHFSIKLIILKRNNFAFLFVKYIANDHVLLYNRIIRLNKGVGITFEYFCNYIFHVYLIWIYIYIIYHETISRIFLRFLKKYNENKKKNLHSSDLEKNKFSLLIPHKIHPQTVQSNFISHNSFETSRLHTYNNRCKRFQKASLPLSRPTPILETTFWEGTT